MYFLQTRKLHPYPSPVMMEEVVGEVVEQIRLVGREDTRVDLIDGLLQLGIGLVELSGDVSGV